MKNQSISLEKFSLDYLLKVIFSNLFRLDNFFKNSIIDVNDNFKFEFSIQSKFKLLFLTKKSKFEKRILY